MADVVQAWAGLNLLALLLRIAYVEITWLRREARQR